MPPPTTLGQQRLGQRRSVWSILFGVAQPSTSSVSAIRVQQDDPAIVQRYTGTVLARSPLREISGEDGLQWVSVAETRGGARVRETQFALGVSRSNRRADALAELLENARSQRSIGEVRQDTAKQAADFSQSFQWTLSIPGTHYSGLSNQELLEIFEAQGRPFAQDTPELRAHVRERVAAAFASGPWERARAAAVAARAVREWIVRRLDQQGLDVELEELDPDYRAQKVADGFSSKIGVRTGAWRGSLANGVVEVAA